MTERDDDTDATAQAVALTAPRTLNLLAAFRRGVKVTVRPDEAARLEVALSAGVLSSARISAFNVRWPSARSASPPARAA